MIEDVELEPDLLAYVEERLGRPLDETPPPDEVEEEGVEEEEEGDEGEEENPDEGTGDDEDESEPATPAEPVSETDLIEVSPGISLTRDQALSYYKFDAILRGDPELQNILDEHLRSGRGGETQPTEIAPSSSLPELTAEDLEDPTIKALHDAATRQAQLLNEQNERIKALTDVTMTREQEELAHIINVSEEQFAASHSLNEDELAKVSQVAQRLNVVPALMRGIDPITGAVVPRDRGMAITRALEIAYYYLPEFRERAVETAVADRAKSTKRKQRLAGISGTSGSVPKGTPIRNATDRRNAMIAEVAGLMGQSTETE